MGAGLACSPVPCLSPALATGLSTELGLTIVCEQIEVEPLLCAAALLASLPLMCEFQILSKVAEPRFKLRSVF